MKKICLFVLIVFCFPEFSYSDFDELGKNAKVLENNFNFSSSSLKVVQKRLLPKKYLSEFSLAVSPVLKGLIYMNSYSFDASYRFFLNNHWNVQLKYSRYYNLISKEGFNEVQNRARIPVELKYPQKQSYLGGVEWYPFYGKAVLYNYLVRFDLYLSILGGKTEILNLNESVYMGSLGLGLVYWWHKHFNTRLEMQGSYYKYNIFDKLSENRDITEYFYKTYISVGVLF